MQFRNKYDFMNDGTLDIIEYYDSNDELDVEYLTEVLNSSEALEYLRTLYIPSILLCECRNIVGILRDYIWRTNKLIDISLDAHSDDYVPVYDEEIFDYLDIFKNVTTASLDLRTGDSECVKVAILKKYFSSPINVKNLYLTANIDLIFEAVESINADPTIETVHLIITNVKKISSSWPIFVVQKLTELQLRLEYCRIHSDHENAFNIYLQKLIMLNPSITCLRLQNLPINTNTVNTIATIIKTGGLTRLSICACKINDDQIDILAAALENSSVTELDIAYNDTKHEGALCVANLLKLNTSLTYVCVNNNKFTYDDVIEIMSALSLNLTVRRFSCTIPDVRGASQSISQTFAEILTNNYTLTDFVSNIDLSTITNRNKEFIERSRFAKVKTIISDNSDMATQYI